MNHAGTMFTASKSADRFTCFVLVVLVMFAFGCNKQVGVPKPDDGKALQDTLENLSAPSSEKIALLAAKYGISESSLSNCVRQYSREHDRTFLILQNLAEGKQADSATLVLRGNTNTSSMSTLISLSEGYNIRIEKLGGALADYLTWKAAEGSRGSSAY
jgi:hypothetical protein